MLRHCGILISRVVYSRDLGTWETYSAQRGYFWGYSVAIPSTWGVMTPSPRFSIREDCETQYQWGRLQISPAMTNISRILLIFLSPWGEILPKRLLLAPSCSGLGNGVTLIIFLLSFVQSHPQSLCPKEFLWLLYCILELSTIMFWYIICLLLLLSFWKRWTS